MDIMPILSRLQSGEVCSGTDLGVALGISRAAIHKQVVEATRLGLDIRTIKGKGYQLLTPLSLLDRNEIIAGLPTTSQGGVRCVDVLTLVGSTNEAVNQKHAHGEGHLYCCLAEHQTSGRGRLGRVWCSPFGANIYLSIGWLAPRGVSQLEGLSLIVGYCIAMTLKRLGFQGVTLKWPNDVLIHGKKVAGVLVELSGDLHGPCCVTVGVGLNVNMAPSRADIDRPWIDLSSVLGELPASSVPDSIKVERQNGQILSRSKVAKLLIADIIEGVNKGLKHGFSYYWTAWARFDHFKEKPITFYQDGNEISGIGKGVNAQGQYRINVDGEFRYITSGEVSSQNGGYVQA